MIVIPPSVYAAAAKRAAAVNADGSKADAPIDETASRSEPSEQRAIALAILASAAGVALLVALLTITLWSRTVGAQPAPQQGAQAAPTQSAFVIARGTDTIAVERVTRGRASVLGDLTIRNAARFSYVATLESGNAVPLLTFQVFGSGAPVDALPLQAGSLRVSADSVIVEAAGQRMATLMQGAPIPLFNLSYALTELMFARARAAGGTAYTGKFVIVGGGPMPATIESIGSDSAVLTAAGVVQRFAIDAEGNITGGTVPAQGLTITRVTGAAAANISLGRTDYSAPAGAPYTAEEVTVRTRAGHLLTGTLTIPRGVNGRVPAVVTITGSGQSDRDEFIPLVPNYRPFRQLADTLGRRGIAVLRLDDRGINGSGGDVQKATSADFADDVRAGVAFLRARPDIDPDRIALFGHSEGGLIGPMVAATDAKLAGLVIFAGPAYTGRKILDFQIRNLVMGSAAISAAKKDSVLKAQLAEVETTAAKLPWMKYFLDYDPLPTLRRVKSPVLILHGGTDQQVTPEQAPIIEKTLKDAGNRDVTMRVLADRNHLFLNDTSGFPGGYTKLKDGRIGADVMGPLADWIALKLGAPRPQP